ncbi:hypothetical protein Dimus_006221 [Dionaea muscipula]
MSVIHLKKKDVVKSKVRGVEMEFDHEKLATILGSGENRRRDDDVDAPEEEAEEEDEGNKDDFDWEAQKEQDASRVDPSCPTDGILEVVMTKLQAEFERKRANRFLADLEKAKAENARLLALLHQAKSKPNP